MKDKPKNKYFEEIRKDIIIGIASGAVVGFIFMIGDAFSEIAIFNGLGDGWAFLIKALVSCIGIVFVIKYFDIKKFK